MHALTHTNTYAHILHTHTHKQIITQRDTHTQPQFKNPPQQNSPASLYCLTAHTAIFKILQGRCIKFQVGTKPTVPKVMGLDQNVQVSSPSRHSARPGNQSSRGGSCQFLPHLSPFFFSTIVLSTIITTVTMHRPSSTGVTVCSSWRWNPVWDRCASFCYLSVSPGRRKHCESWFVAQSSSSMLAQGLLHSRYLKPTSQK